MKNYTSREIINILKAEGWQHIRTEGSHHHFRQLETGKIATVPHPKKSLPIGTLKVITKQTGIKL